MANDIFGIEFNGANDVLKQPNLNNNNNNLIIENINNSHNQQQQPNKQQVKTKTIDIPKIDTSRLKILKKDDDVVDHGDILNTAQIINNNNNNNNKYDNLNLMNNNNNNNNNCIEDQNDVEQNIDVESNLLSLPNPNNNKHDDDYDGADEDVTDDIPTSITVVPIASSSNKRHRRQPTSSSSLSFYEQIDASLLTFKKNSKTLLITFMFALLAVVINLTVLAVIHERVPYGEPPLPDISFELLPKLNKALDISEFIIIFMTWSLLIMLTFHRYKYIIFSRLFTILALLYIFRAFCMAVTQVPVANPQYYCSPRINQTNPDEKQYIAQYIKTIIWRVLYMSVGMGLSVNGHHTYCGDFIFSGHTVILATSDLFLMYYWITTISSKVLKIFLQLLYHTLVIFGIIAILIARGHYLVDVILGLLISILTFYSYHILCHYSLVLYQLHNQHRHHHHHKKNPLNVWWYKIFEFLESNTIKNGILIQNEFDIWILWCKNNTNDNSYRDTSSQQDNNRIIF